MIVTGKLHYRSTIIEHGQCQSCQRRVEGHDCQTMRASEYTEGAAHQQPYSDVVVALFGKMRQPPSSSGMVAHAGPPSFAMAATRAAMTASGVASAS